MKKEKYQRARGMYDITADDRRGNKGVPQILVAEVVPLTVETTNTAQEEEEQKKEQNTAIENHVTTANKSRYSHMKQKQYAIITTTTTTTFQRQPTHYRRRRRRAKWTRGNDTQVTTVDILVTRTMCTDHHLLARP